MCFIIIVTSLHIAHLINSLSPGNFYVSWTWSSEIQVLVCCLFNPKPLSQSMLTYCQLYPKEKISVKYECKNKKILHQYTFKFCPFYSTNKVLTTRTTCFIIIVRDVIMIIYSNATFKIKYLQDIFPSISAIFPFFFSPHTILCIIIIHYIQEIYIYIRTICIKLKYLLSFHYWLKIQTTFSNNLCFSFL